MLRYTTDGDLSIDNNLSERRVKIATPRRKYSFFVGSLKGGLRAAVHLVSSPSPKQTAPNHGHGSATSSLNCRMRQPKQSKLCCPTDG